MINSKRNSNLKCLLFFVKLLYLSKLTLANNLTLPRNMTTDKPLTTNITLTTTPIITTTSTTTTTSSTIPTTTTTTTMKPCPKMRFLNRVHQATPDVSTFVGSTFMIDCSVDHTGGPEPVVQWLKDEIPLVKNSYRTFDENTLAKTFKLRLENIDVPDFGRYKCKVKNPCSKSITNTVNIIVRESVRKIPFVTKFGPMNSTKTVGEEITLTCSTELNHGESTPYIKWVHKRFINITTTSNNETNSNTTTTTAPTRYNRLDARAKANTSAIVPKMNSIAYVKDGVKHIVTDLKYEQAASSSLLLKDLSLADSGVYTCVMSNLKGVVRKSTYLTVNPVPKPTVEELEQNFVEKYGPPQKQPQHDLYLKVGITLPVFVIVLLSTACIWWSQYEKRKLKERDEREKREQFLIARASQVPVEPPKPKITIDPAVFENSIGFLTNSEKSLTSERTETDVSEDNERRHLLDDHEDESATMAENNTENGGTIMVDVGS